MIIFQSDQEIHDTRSIHRGNRLALIGKICRMDLRRSRHCLGIAADEPERLLPFGQKFDEFIAVDRFSGMQFGFLLGPQDSIRDLRRLERGLHVVCAHKVRSLQNQSSLRRQRSIQPSLGWNLFPAFFVGKRSSNK